MFKKFTELHFYMFKDGSQVTANNNRIEDVNDFVYFGSNITANGDSTIDVKYRITKARADFRNLRNIWKSSSIRTQTKIRILKTNTIAFFCMVLSPGMCQITYPKTRHLPNKMPS